MGVTGLLLGSVPFNADAERHARPAVPEMPVWPYPVWPCICTAANKENYGSVLHPVELHGRREGHDRGRGAAPPRETPNATLLRKLSGDTWVDVSAKTFADEVDAVAKGIVASGINPGDRVALLSSTRYEWTVIDYAIWRAGGVTVAIYDTSTRSGPVDPEDSATRLLIVELPKHRSQHQEVIAAAPALTETLVIDEGAIATLTERGAAVDNAELDTRHANTRGIGRGNPDLHLRHHRPAQRVSRSPTPTCWPRAPHARARWAGSRRGQHDAAVPAAGTSSPAPSRSAASRTRWSSDTSDIPNLVAHLDKYKPHYVLSVPRVFEKVYNSAKQKAYDGGKGGIFEKASATAVEYSKALDAGGQDSCSRANARRVRQARLRQTPRCTGRQLHRRGVRRRTARRSPGPLLPRRRHPGVRGVRPHRDQRRHPGQQCRRPAHRFGGPAGTRL